MLTLPGVPDPLPALLVSLQQTSSDAAWQHLRHTVCLLAPLPAIRVHARAGAGAASREGLAFGAGTVGRWFAIGDVVLTRSAYSAEHALPESFTHQDDWLLPAGTVLNVGRAGPLFGHQGGALQAEWLSGPRPERRRIEGYWTDQSGNA
jgi:hypothetical protein